MNQTAEVKRAKFSFEKFRVVMFNYTESENKEDTLNLNFEPSGKYFAKDGTYELLLGFNAFEGEDPNNSVIALVAVAQFKFEEGTKLEDIHDYFYRNAIAMVYPFIRSFVSSLSVQCGGKLVILPVMNLAELEETLKTNTISQE